MTILGLRSAIYPAKDLAAAKKWYTRVLGAAPYFDEPCYVGFSVGGFEFGLVPDREPGTAGVRAYWGVPDAAEAFDQLLMLGATSEEPVTDVGGGIKVASVRDPFGNLFSVVENPHFKPEAAR